MENFPIFFTYTFTYTFIEHNMRVKFTLILAGKHKTLPVNYNYFLTGLIYKIIKNSSEDYSEFLHNNGYRFPESKKGFKLFTYSMLMGKKARVKGETISFGDGNIHWQISSPVDTFIQHLITGVFTEGQEIKVGEESLLIEPIWN